MKAHIISITFILSLVGLTGCTSTYTSEVMRTPAGKLQRGHSVLIHTPADGRYGSRPCVGSGQMTADALKSGFGAYSQDVRFVPPGHNRNSFSGLSNIYYVQPEILHWEERATEWSGKPDVIRVKIDVFETGSMSHLSSVIIKGKSKWLTFGGDHPQDLLPKPIQDHLKTLY